MSQDDQELPDPRPPDQRDRPLVRLTNERVGCALHLEPFRKRWPAGFAVFSVTLFQQVMAGVVGEKLVEDIRRYHGLAPDAEVDIELVEGALDRKPACCRLTPAQLKAAYLASKVGHLNRCKHCGRKAMGTEIKHRDGEAVRTIRHVCFDCLVTAWTESN
jgi:hypothetical protein